MADEEVQELTLAERLDVPALRAWLVAHAVPGVDEVVAGDDGSTLVELVP